MNDAQRKTYLETRLRNLKRQYDKKPSDEVKKDIEETEKAIAMIQA